MGKDKRYFREITYSEFINNFQQKYEIAVYCKNNKLQYVYMNKRQLIGYTCGVYDLFHIGHLNLLKNAKSLCDKLIVGVSTDELASYKNKQCVIPYRDRAEIVSSIKYVDCVVPQTTRDKIEAYKKLKFDILFVGDDWFENDEWKTWENELQKYRVSVVYFPYTPNVSSTKIIKHIENNKKNE